MIVSTTGGRTEENTTRASHYQRRRRVQSKENTKQKNIKRKRKVLSIIEGVYGRGRYLGK